MRGARRIERAVEMLERNHIWCSINLELLWHGDNNGTDESLTGCYSSSDDPRREDKAGLHVNCDDLLGGYDCRSRCLAGGRRKQQTFYPSILPSFCSCLS
jgi:hypothetical protein